jgi:hypothetical protein
MRNQEFVPIGSTNDTASQSFHSPTSEAKDLFILWRMTVNCHSWFFSEMLIRVTIERSLVHKDHFKVSWSNSLKFCSGILTFRWPFVNLHHCTWQSRRASILRAVLDDAHPQCDRLILASKSGPIGKTIIWNCWLNSDSSILIRLSTARMYVGLDPSFPPFLILVEPLADEEAKKQHVRRWRDFKYVCDQARRKKVKE